MDCLGEINKITQSDFACVGLVAKHCDLQKLCIATEEAKDFDIIPLFCFDFVQDILNNWNIPAQIPNPDFVDIETTPEVSPIIINPDYEKYQNLICGGNYTANEKLHQNLGFKKAWIYYSYARYLLVNQFNDTANGMVSKENEWSNQIPMADIRDLSNKYRNMGKAAYESLLGYLCANKESFPKFDGCNCKLSCGCSGSCGCGKTKKMTGIKFSTVTK